MMIVDIGVTQVKVTFFHIRERIFNTGITRCNILSLRDNEPRASGDAICSSKDIFNKSTGRKIALQRALKNGSFTREERTKIWEAYWTKTKKQ